MRYIYKNVWNSEMILVVRSMTVGFINVNMKTVYLGFCILAKFWVNIQRGDSKNWLIWKYLLLKTNFANLQR